VFFEICLRLIRELVSTELPLFLVERLPNGIGLVGRGGKVRRLLNEGKVDVPEIRITRAALYVTTFPYEYKDGQDSYHALLPDFFRGNRRLAALEEHLQDSIQFVWGSQVVNQQWQRHKWMFGIRRRAQNAICAIRVEPIDKVFDGRAFVRLRLHLCHFREFEPGGLRTAPVVANVQSIAQLQQNPMSTSASLRCASMMVVGSVVGCRWGWAASRVGFIDSTHADDLSIACAPHPGRITCRLMLLVLLSD
jgi:hypothetical protein